jgi:hypothetical protein
MLWFYVCIRLKAVTSYSSAQHQRRIDHYNAK